MLLAHGFVLHKNSIFMMLTVNSIYPSDVFQRLFVTAGIW
jgi:hypothetical protein